MDYLRELKRDFARRKAIKALPPGLPETYRRIMDRIGKIKDDLALARKALLWLVFCKRPLNLRELVIAIAIEPQDAQFEESKMLDYDEQILEICGPLVKFDGYLNVVELGHFSVKEYLTSKLLPDGTDNPDFLDDIDGNAELMKCCLTYLSFLEGPDKEAQSVAEYFTERELLGYAVEWPLHATEVESQPSHCDVIIEFFSSPTWGNTCMMWSRWWQYQHRYSQHPRVDHSSSLYYAALFGLDRVADKLLTNTPVNDSMDSYSHALIVAGQMGNLRLMRLLLAANADITARDRDGMTALDRAAWNGHTEAVRMLLDAKANAMNQDRDGMTALHRAARGQHVEVVKTLLKAKVDVRIEDHNGCTALHDAALGGNVEVVKLLLNANADATAKDKYGRTAKSHAARIGTWEVVKILMNVDVSTEAQVKEDMETVGPIAVGNPFDKSESATTEVLEKADSTADQTLTVKGYTQLGCSGIFTVKDLRHAYRKNAAESMEITFASPYPEPPEVVLGLRELNADGGNTLRIQTWAEKIQADKFCINLHTWMESIIYTSECTWLAVATDDRNFQCGQFSTKELWDWYAPQSETSRRIEFRHAYASKPQVIIWICGIDMSNQNHWRLRTHATDITATGFTIRVDTWADTVLYSGEVCWFAFPTGIEGLCVGSYSTMEAVSFPQPDGNGQVSFKKTVRFGKNKFSTVPRILLGINMFDIPCENDFRVRASVESATTTEMTLQICLQSGTRTSPVAEISYVVLKAV